MANPKKPKDYFSFPAVVLSWHDGDTLRCDIDLWFHHRWARDLRLAGLDAAEINSKDAVKRAKAAAALARAAELCPPGTKVSVVTDKPDATDKYKRWLGTVWFDRGGVRTCLNDVLIAEGHGTPYGGGRRG